MESGSFVLRTTSVSPLDRDKDKVLDPAKIFRIFAVPPAEGVQRKDRLFGLIAFPYWFSFGIFSGRRGSGTAGEWKKFRKRLYK